MDFAKLLKNTYFAKQLTVPTAARSLNYFKT